MRLAVVCMNSAVLSRGWQIVRMTRAVLSGGWQLFVSRMLYSVRLAVVS